MHNYLEIPKIKLSYSNPIPANERVVVEKSETLADFFRAIWDSDTIELQMELKAVFLNNANSPIGILELSKGAITACYGDPRILFATALQCGAIGLAICRNAPSGQLDSGIEDRRYITKIAEIGKFHEIKVLDFIILSKEEYSSLSDLGLFY